MFGIEINHFIGEEKDMGRPKVSIIIPIYNTERYLKRCIESVIRQTLSEIEIILVDDGSPDNSPSICDDYVRKDPRIRVIHQKNAGLGLSRNAGIEVATGEYVAFLDSDDYIEDDMYKSLYTGAKKKNADTCICGHKFVRNNGTVIEYKNAFHGNVYKGYEVNSILLSMLGARPKDTDDIVIEMSVWKAIFSLELIKRNNIRFCSERKFISEDIIFDIDYFQKAKCVTVIRETPYFYCENTSSLSRTFREDRILKCIQLYQEELRKLKDTEYYSEAKVRIQRIFLGNLRTHIKQAVFQFKKEDALKYIKEAADKEEVQAILNEYPYQQNPKQLQIFNKLLHKKRVKALWLTVKLKKLIRA